MTISRVKPANWGVGEKLTSAQQNQLDTNVSYALDKRSGETDDLESVVSCLNGGRIVKEQITGADANTTYAVGDGGVIWIPSTLTASRTYTLGTTGASAGDEIDIACDPDLLYRVTVNNHDATVLFMLGYTSSCEGSSAVFRFDGTDWHVKQGKRAVQKSDYYTSSDTWTCPRGVTEVILHGVGAGGGGGGGGGSGAGLYAGTGAGGGGALLGMLRVPVTPGVVYTITIGTGGTAGAGGTAGTGDGNNGGDGGDTTFVEAGPTTLATFYGAGGGTGGRSAAEANAYSKGGRARRNGQSLVWTATSPDPPLDQEGGIGGPDYQTAVSASYYRTGGGSPVAAGAAAGADFGDRHGGAGGGASGWAGCVPGVGGDYDGGTGTAGTLGAGGGGGGAGASTSAGGNGGAGGNGALRIIYVK